MTQIPIKITQAEYEVMEVLWNKAPLAATQITKQLDDEKEWSPTTIKTLLSRLVEKRALNTKQDGRRFLYSPAISRSDYARTQTRQFVDKLFDGRAAPLVAHLAETRDGLTQDDIAELEALLEALKDDHQ